MTSDQKRVGPPVARAVTFDLWYTLVYLRRAEQRRVARVRRRLWGEPLLRLGYSRSETARLLRAMDGWGEREHALGKAPSVEQHARWLARRVHHRLPVDEIRSSLDRLTRAADVRDAPGAKAALRAVRRGGASTALVSTVMHESGSATREILALHGLYGEFDALVLSCERRYSKPRPEPFREALRRLRVPPTLAAHVGDDRFDVEGALAAGVRPILYTGLAASRPVARLKAPAGVMRHAVVARSWARFPSVLAA